MEQLFSKEVFMLIDSGASHHAISADKFLLDFKKFDKPIAVTTATENPPSLVVGRGILLALLTFDQIKFILSIDDVYHIPNLTDRDSLLRVRKFNT